jgi:DNA replication protein DnaC
LTLYKCVPDIGSVNYDTGKVEPSDEIFKMSILQAIQMGLLKWPRTHPDEFRRLMSWTERTPLMWGDRTRAFFLCGPHRTGKSLFAKLFALKIYNEETEVNRARTGLVKFASVKSLVNTYMHLSSDDKQAFERQIAAVKYLFLDDIGHHYDTTWNEKQLIDWLGRRLNSKYSDGRKVWTFFTSNSSIDELGLDPAAVSRIRESALEIKLGQTFKAVGGRKPTDDGSFLHGNPTNS